MPHPRHYYTVMDPENVLLYRQLKHWLRQDLDISQAAAILGLTTDKARFIVRWGSTSLLELKNRRKEYIVEVLTGPVSHRHTAYAISCYFKVDERYVEQLMRELRYEGRLPPSYLDEKDREEHILLVLRRRYPNVYRASTVGKQDELGDQIYVAGKGWMTWDMASDLADSLENKKSA